jgi:histidinol-phosphate aminotransferase
VADVLNRIRGPFNVTSAALAAGQAALEDGGYTDLVYRHNNYWRDWFVRGLAEIGLEAVPSVANFVLVRFPTISGQDAAAADEHLRSKRIIVRPMRSYGLPEYLRITIGRDDEMQAVMAALKEFRGA